MATARQPVSTGVQGDLAAANSASPTPEHPGQPPQAHDLDLRTADMRNVDDRFEALLRHAQSNRPNEDISLIRKAWEFCGRQHDAVEDTPATNQEIASAFGDQVAHIVEGVTKIDKIQFANREDRQAENVRKMLLAMVSDVRVVLIKLADRLHNMRTLEHLKPERQEAIARETLDIYAPLAHRLGM